MTLHHILDTNFVKEARTNVKSHGLCVQSTYNVLKIRLHLKILYLIKKQLLVAEIENLF